MLYCYGNTKNVTVDIALIKLRFTIDLTTKEILLEHLCSCRYKIICRDVNMNLRIKKALYLTNDNSEFSYIFHARVLSLICHS